MYNKVKRYWYQEKNATYFLEKSVIDDFMVDNDTFSNKASTFEDIAKIPFLILLGEPGMGKSTELLKVMDMTSENKLYVDLKICYSIENIIEQIFNNKQILEWKSSNEPIYLFLDSFDECQARISELDNILIQEFKKIKEYKERIFIRIVSRSTSWPSYFRKDMIDNWYGENQKSIGESKIQIFILAPFNQKNILELISEKNIDTHKFIQEAAMAKVIPFLLRPVTLNMLTSIYAEREMFPVDVYDLYLKGCHRLCAEYDSKRIEKKLSKHLSLQESFSIVTRIAGISIFTNRNIFILDQFCEELNTVTISEIADGTDNSIDSCMQIKESDIREVLETALFTTTGDGRYTWSHYSYAEFLAAHYVIIKQFTNEQLEALLMEDISNEVKTVNPLVETATWVASKNTRIRELLIKYNPEVAIKSDLSHFTMDERKNMIINLLQSLEEHKLDYSRTDFNIYISGLNFDGIEQILLDYIENPKFHLISRQQALIIYGVCIITKKNTIATLFKILNNTKENVLFKKECVLYINKFGIDSDKLKLRKFIIDNDDTDYRLRGAILGVLWPSLIETKEMLKYLSVRKNEENIYGSYEMFISKVERSNINSELDIYAEWILELDKKFMESSRHKKLVIIIKNLLYANVTDHFYIICKIIYNDFQNSYFNTFEKSTAFYNELSIKNKNIFWKYIINITESITDFEKIIRYLHFPNHNEELLMSAIDEYSNDEINHQIYWLKLIVGLFDYSMSGLVVNKLYSLMLQDDNVNKELNHIFTAVELNSDIAVNARAELQRKKNANKDEINADVMQYIMNGCKEDINEYLENNNIDILVNIIYNMSIDQNGYCKFMHEVDIQKTFLWKKLDAETKLLLVKGMKSFPTNVKKIRTSDVEENQVTYEQLCTFKILYYLWSNENEILKNLEFSIWELLINSIVKFPCSTDSNEETTKNAMLSVVYSKNSEFINNLIMEMLEKENKNSDTLFSIRLAESIWNENLVNKIVTKYKNEELSAKSLEFILENAPDNKIQFFYDFLFTIAENIRQVNQYKRELIINSVQIYMKFFREEYWLLVWSYMEVDIDFGREIIKKMSSFRNHNLSKMPEENVIELYQYIQKEYPEKEDPMHSGSSAYWISPRDEIASFRNNLITNLRVRGSKLAYEKLNKLSEISPNNIGLKYALIESKENVKKNIWNPISTNDLLQLTQSSDNVLINSEKALIKLIEKLLGELQNSLQCENPNAQFLWNEQKNSGKEKTYTPKTENEFSDYVTNFLREKIKSKGIVVNREVEIRRSGGSVTGERPDIVISATSKTTSYSYRQLEVIIEVKGNWHDDLLFAMENQLEKRYLISNPNSQGLYLVGWFASNKWDEKDSRLQKTRKFSKEELIKKLTIQASNIDNNSVNFYVLDCSF